MYDRLKGQRAKKIRKSGNISIIHTREDINILVETNNKNAEIIDDLLLVISDMAFRISQLENN